MAEQPDRGKNQSGKEGKGNKPRFLVVESTTFGSLKRQPDGIFFKVHVRCIVSGPIRGASFRFLVDARAVGQGNFVSLGGEGGRIAEADLLLKGEEAVITLELRDDQRRLHSFTVSTMKLPEPKKRELLSLRGLVVNGSESEVALTIAAADESGKGVSREYYLTDVDEDGTFHPYHGKTELEVEEEEGGPNRKVNGVCTVTLPVLGEPRTVVIFSPDHPEEKLEVQIPGRKKPESSPTEPPVPGAGFLRKAIQAAREGRRIARGEITRERVNPKKKKKGGV